MADGPFQADYLTQTQESIPSTANFSKMDGPLQTGYPAETFVSRSMGQQLGKYSMMEQTLARLVLVTCFQILVAFPL
ncbi:hypothetical protein [Paenibacillus uliginis]|uniref:hypothetical protein n=1 Tax=Paenibacillus uliginis TaxID=683737 RepID=UPI001AD8212C|nr:hypothetical protein [Paenibacillus uliginis]